MGRTTISDMYWRSRVERSIGGIVNSTLSKHGTGRPYVQMRNTMVLGTIITTDRRFIRARVLNQEPIAIVRASGSMNPADCSCALAKMTATVYQNEVDAAKHGKSSLG